MNAWCFDKEEAKRNRGENPNYRQSKKKNLRLGIEEILRRQNQQLMINLETIRRLSIIEFSNIIASPYSRSIEPHGELTMQNILVTRKSFNVCVLEAISPTQHSFDPLFKVETSPRIPRRRRAKVLRPVSKLPTQS